MTVLSVNVNKIALLRNSRGRDYPSVVDFANRVIDLGVKGITVHPRPDARHITRQDVYDLAALLADRDDVEFNIEGYPSDAFLDLVCDVRPDQCTLVPDDPNQLTSDHGWDVDTHLGLLQDVLGRLSEAAIRSSLFLDPLPSRVASVPSTGADRIELYTEDFASAFGTDREMQVWSLYAQTASKASELGIGLNAGHDLNLYNLARFLEIPDILEVSIGHALVVECLEFGVAEVIQRYLALTGD